MKLALLASGRGTNLRAVLQLAERHVEIEPIGFVSDVPACPAETIAKEAGLPTRTVAPSQYASRAAWDAALADSLEALEPDWVVLAGFMRIVGPRVLQAFPSRILNIHPSLLPAFPGLDAPKQAIAAGVRISGCTVHLVDSGIDSGPILAQAAVPVTPEDTAETLHARIQAAEHKLLPSVLLQLIRRHEPPLPVHTPLLVSPSLVI